jgi:hypothetical protein
MPLSTHISQTVPVREVRSAYVYILSVHERNGMNGGKIEEK